MNAPEDALAGILAEHEESHQIDGDYGELVWVECSCGADFEDPEGYGSGYRSHRAQVLAEWVAGEKARAVRALADDPRAMQAVRLHLEDELVEWRDAGRFMLRNNGFAIRGRDGSGPTIRFGTELGMGMALRLLADQLDPREGA